MPGRKGHGHYSPPEEGGSGGGSGAGEGIARLLAAEAAGAKLVAEARKVGCPPGPWLAGP
jgi:hypothetical protein